MNGGPERRSVLHHMWSEWFVSYAREATVLLQSEHPWPIETFQALNRVLCSYCCLQGGVFNFTWHETEEVTRPYLHYNCLLFSCIPESNNYATSEEVAGSNPDEVMGFLNWPNPSSRTMSLGSTQPITEMSTRNLPGGIWRTERKADLTANCEPTVYKMWEPRRLTTLWASTACCRDSFTFFLPYLIRMP
jgi:hypothetical protein